MSSGVKRFAPLSSKFLGMVTQVPDVRLHNNPERVSVVIFGGDKAKFYHLLAVISSCGNEGSE